MSTLIVVTLALGALAVGVLFGLDTAGLLPSGDGAGFVGMGLGVLCLLGGFAASMDDL